MRAELLRFVSEGGQKVTNEDEPAWLRKVRKKASAELSVRLDAIDAFEAVSELLTRALNAVRFLSTSSRASVGAKEFTRSRDVSATAICRALPGALSRLERTFDVIGYRTYADPLLARYCLVRTPAELFDAVMAHHADAQKNKPPDGKRPWFDQEGNAYLVRLLYQFPEPPSEDDSVFVHQYRTSTASSFLADLRRVQ
jgi:hypothetical protein